MWGTLPQRSILVAYCLPLRKSHQPHLLPAHVRALFHLKGVAVSEQLALDTEAVIAPWEGTSSWFPRVEARLVCRCLGCTTGSPGVLRKDRVIYPSMSCWKILRYQNEVVNTLILTQYRWAAYEVRSISYKTLLEVTKNFCRLSRKP